MIHSYIYQMGDSSRLLRRAFDARMRQLGVTGPQARLLLELSKAEGENQGHYAERLEVEPITLCRMVDRMEESGCRFPRPTGPRLRRCPNCARTA